mmetsp:Transcript_17630/g.49194  ORF Transcript_17630/g.49194 Transcript_17630/m.49194 type:complete len:87 (+) Transcript_17630:568-828(+)
MAWRTFKVIGEASRRDCMRQASGAARLIAHNHQQALLLPPARPHLGRWLQRQGPVGPEVAACDPGCGVAELWAARRWCCAAQGTTA